MYVCPICNGLNKKYEVCHNCHEEMEEKGRLIEQLGDYAPYLEDEGMKLVDGDIHSRQNHFCVHVFVCPSCEAEKVESIEEIKL